MNLIKNISLDYPWAQLLNSTQDQFRNISKLIALQKLQYWLTDYLYVWELLIPQELSCLLHIELYAHMVAWLKKQYRSLTPGIISTNPFLGRLVRCIQTAFWVQWCVSTEEVQYLTNVSSVPITYLPKSHPGTVWWAALCVEYETWRGCVGLG